ncbi:MAG: methylisocitrate lyase [Fimbriimonadaceae bacterium]|nr:methylisocitrate lyase [Fimbriimonadaceae bacterium]
MIRKLPASPGRALRDLMAQDIVVLPGVFNALSAKVAFDQGAKALYITGAGVTNANLGVPDIALITLGEMAEQANRVTQVAPIPAIADADTGYGASLSVMRTVREFERAGVAGLHLEDQASPKRCGHLDGKELVSPSEMAKKVLAASETKSDPDFLIVARTDARGVEGIHAAIERAKRYVDVGADAVFPEGLTTEAEFEAFRRALDVPLLANMTEFGKTPIIPVSRFRELGYNLVIFPMTAFRVMLKAISEAYGELLAAGTQEGLLPRMHTRAQLYETVDYPAFERLDSDWSNRVDRRST